MADMDEDTGEDFSLSNAEVVTKHKTAAVICNSVIAHLMTKIAPGAKVVDLCREGDEMINAELGKKYMKLKEKGVAFPTCVSLNHCVGHFSPLSEDQTVLAEGDVVKIDLGAQIDGIISVMAHTVICTTDPTKPVTGKAADVICAVHYATQAAVRLMRPGNKSTQVTEAIQKVAEAFGCQPVDGVLTQNMKRYVIDGNNVILNRANPDHKVEEFVFQENEAYGLDIVMSTGEGKPKENGDVKTTLFKRAVEQNYLLKMKASRYIFSEIDSRFPTFPFTLRAFDEKKARLGITELLNHGLVNPYPVLFEKPGELVAQFKSTVLILPASISKITEAALPFVQSEKKIEDPTLNHILSLGLKRSTKKKGKKKKAGKAAAAGADGAEEMETD